MAESITRDFRLLAPLAAATARTGALKFLNLKQTLAQFSATMTAQVRRATGITAWVGLEALPKR